MMQVLLEWTSIVTLRKTQHNTVFADSESVFYTCVFGFAVVARAAPRAYQRC
jgi:hypothetical protein